MLAMKMTVMNCNKDSMAVVNCNNPIWHCKNAFKLEDTCKHAVCSTCFINNEHGNDNNQGQKAVDHIEEI
eukprot:15347762-Ditylum_brightwellii.AAC.1